MLSLQKAVDLVNARPLVTSRDLMFGFVGSLFIAFCAQISFSLPFTMVPTSCQPQGVLLTAAVLGPRRGFLAVLAYLLEGAVGLPVFAQFHMGWAILLGTTGGYLWSYLPVSLLVGWFCEAFKWNQLKSGVVMLLGNALVIASGTAWLCLFVGSSAAWMMGAAPFIVTCSLKVVMATLLLPTVHRLLRGHLDQS